MLQEELYGHKIESVQHRKIMDDLVRIWSQLIKLFSFMIFHRGDVKPKHIQTGLHQKKQNK